MILRPIIIYSSQTNSPSFFYYYQYHYTKHKIGKNIICRGNSCCLCNHGLKKYHKYIIPVFYLKGKYINIKVLYEDYNFTKKLFDIIKENQDHFKDNNLMRDIVYFIDNFNVVKISPTDYIIGRYTRENLKKITDDFEKNYLSKYFIDDKMTYDIYCQELNKNK